MKTKIFQRYFFIAFLVLAGCFPLVSLGVAMTLLWIPQSAIAAWPGDPNVNVPICTASGVQQYQSITSDGSDGAIITWEDWRSGNRDIYAQRYDIYAQRVDASGTVKWPGNGAPICIAQNDLWYFTVVSDGGAGAIITWRDNRSGNYDIYAQRVDVS